MVRQRPSDPRSCYDDEPLTMPREATQDTQTDRGLDLGITGNDNNEEGKKRRSHKMRMKTDAQTKAASDRQTDTKTRGWTAKAKGGRKEEEEENDTLSPFSSSRVADDGLLQLM